MALILAIETGTDICSVALVRDGELVALRESDEERNHAKKIAVFVDELLRECGVGADELDAVAVSKGPGSYTGLRIGVSFAQGLCYGQNIPLVAVGSLDSLVEVAREDFEAGIVDVENWNEAVLCPMIDARRMEVYTQLFNSEGVAQSDVEAKIIDEESFSEERKGKPFVIFGSGAKKCAEVLEGATFIEVVPSARGMARLAEKAFAEGKTEDVAYFEPFYLKDFVVGTAKKSLLERVSESGKRKEEN